MGPESNALDFVKARCKAGLTDETMLILIWLKRQGASRLVEVSEGCQINATTLPRYLSRLMMSGHVLKSSGEADGRERFFSLSDHGLRLINGLMRHFRCQDRSV